MCERLRMQGTHIPRVRLPSREEMRVETTPPSARDSDSSYSLIRMSLWDWHRVVPEETSLFVIEKRWLQFCNLSGLCPWGAKKVQSKVLIGKIKRFSYE